jgi:hypothetical protein
MFKYDPLNPETTRRRTLEKVYALLIRLAEEKENQTALPDHFSEETGKADEQPTTEMEACNE